MILWRDVDETSMISMQKLMKIFFCGINLGNIDISLLLPRWSLMTLSREKFEKLIFSMETFMVFIVFVVLTSESLFFRCWFLDVSLMIIWGNIDVTAMFSMQKLMIISVFIHISSETLLFHCCSLADRWWFFGEMFSDYWLFRWQLFWTSLFLLC